MGYRGGRGRGGGGGRDGNFRSGCRGGCGRGAGSKGGGGRGTFGGDMFNQGPPCRVIPLGHMSYACQDGLVCKVDIEDVPYFNAPIYLENKEQIGKIDEIFGNLRDYSVSIKLGENMKATSVKKNEKLFIDPGKLLPLNRFLPRAPQPKGPKRKVGSVGGGRGIRGGGFSRGGCGGFGRGSGGGGGLKKLVDGGGGRGRGRQSRGGGRSRW